MRVWVFYIHFFSSKSFNNGSHGNHDTATTQHTQKITMDVSKIARKNTPNTLFAMRACFICLKQVLFKYIYIYLNIYKYCFLFKSRILSFKHHTVWFIHIDTYIWFNQQKKTWCFVVIQIFIWLLLISILSTIHIQRQANNTHTTMTTTIILVVIIAMWWNDFISIKIYNPNIQHTRRTNLRSFWFLKSIATRILALWLKKLSIQKANFLL